MRQRFERGFRGVKMEIMVNVLRNKGEVMESEDVAMGEMNDLTPIARLRIARSAALDYKRQGKYEKGNICLVLDISQIE